jgi:hypothetical protein
MLNKQRGLGHLGRTMQSEKNNASSKLAAD